MMNAFTILIRVFFAEFLSRGMLAFSVSILLTSSVLAGEEPLKILFIGNSYTHMNDMPSIFDKIAATANKNVLVQKNTRSGASFKIHSQRADMYEAIRSQEWDYVILQGYSRECSHSPEHMDTATIPFVQQITDSIYANNACTNVLLYMTWGYEDGYQEREEVNTYEKMADSIKRGYRYLGEYFQVPVFPVGMVWKEVKGRGEIDLYASDRAHPSVNGSFLIASTFFTAIFDESLGDASLKAVKAEYAEYIKRTAFEYVKSHRDEYNLNNDSFSISPTVTEKGQYFLEVQSSFLAANSILWEFDDGKKLTEMNGTHRYKKHGKYTVSLTVDDRCGVRHYQEVVEYRKPKRPKRRRRKESDDNALK